MIKRAPTGGIYRRMARHSTTKVRPAIPREELLNRLQNAACGSSSLDADILEFLGLQTRAEQWRIHQDVPRYTTITEEALFMMPRGHGWWVGTYSTRFAAWKIGSPEIYIGCTPALALCIAIFSTL